MNLKDLGLLKGKTVKTVEFYTDEGERISDLCVVEFTDGGSLVIGCAEFGGAESGLYIEISPNWKYAVGDILEQRQYDAASVYYIIVGMDNKSLDYEIESLDSVDKHVIAKDEIENEVYYKLARRVKLIKEE